MSARPIQTNFVLLDGEQSLDDARAAIAAAGDDPIVIHCGGADYVAIPARLLMALMRLLDEGRNRGYAEQALHVPMPRIFRPLAHAGFTSAKAAKFDAPVVVVVERGKVKGVMGRLAISSVEELCDRVHIDLDRLASGGTRAKPPAKEQELEPDALDVHESMMSEPSGGGGEETVEESVAESAEDTDAVAQPSRPSAIRPAKPLTPTMTPMPGPSVVVNTNDEPQPEAIRLDVATPDAATVGLVFDMAVAIRQPLSPKLAAEGLNRLTSVEGVVYRSERIVKYRVEVEAADCTVEPPSYVFKLQKGRDSLVQYFQLTPKREGVLTIVVNAYQADDDVLAASTRVRLSASVTVDAPAVASATQQAAILRVYQAITNLLTLSDLEDVVFRMGLKWDELAGATLSAKARSLLTLCSAQQLLPALVEQVNAVRPESKLTL